jgi:hypothetical protein
MSIIDIQIPVGFKQGFQSNLDFHNSKYCFKYEYGDNGKRCMIIGEDLNIFLEWFRSLPESKRKLYELIRETDRVAEYYDVDLKITGAMDVDNTSMEIINDVLNARNQVSKRKISNKDLIVLSAHTPDKLSLHIISKKTYFKNSKIQRLFALDVYNELSKKLGTIANIDTSVYSKNRCFRMYLNHKYNKNNTLVLFNPEKYNYASFEETMVVLTHQDISGREENTTYTDDDIVIKSYHDDNERMTDEFQILLAEFIKKHPYLQAETDQTKIFNRINRIDHTTRPCLTNPSDNHSLENMYWYITNNRLYVGCFCRKGAHICLGMRQGIHKIKIEPEPFRYATCSSDDFKTYDDISPDGFKTLYDKRRTGKGKTTSAMRHALNFNKVLLVHHRLSLDDDYICKYPDFVSYHQGIDSDKQTVCFNSLHRINIKNYDLIIIDEIRSILKQTEMKDMMYSTHALFSILEDMSVTVVMLDANMTETDVDYLSTYRKDKKPIIIHDTDVQTDKDVFILDEENKEDLLYKMNCNIEKKNKVVMVYNVSIETMNSILSKYTDDYRVLHVNKLTRKSVDMNTDTWYDNFDIIAYSPTISEGVSINDPRFRNVQAYGFFISTSCPAESVSQMIARFRAIQTFTIHVDTKRVKSIPVFYSKQDVLRYVNNNVDKLHTLSNSHCNVRRERSRLVIIEDEFCDLFCKNMLEQSKDYHNYKSTLIQKLINNGYNVYEDLNKILSVEGTEKVKTEMTELKTLEKERINQAVLDSEFLSTEQYKQLKDAGVSSEIEENKAMKYMIIHSVNINEESLTLDIVNEFREGGKMNIARNIKRCFGFIRNDNGEIERIPTNVLLQEYAHTLLTDFDKKPTFLDQKNSITNFSIARVSWLNDRVVDLGFQYLFSSESIDVEEYLHNLENVLTFYRNNYQEYSNSELLFGKFHNKDRHKELDVKFITGKMYSLFMSGIYIDKESGKVYQQVKMNIRLHDSTRQHPNLLGGMMLSDALVHEYDIMFMKGIYGKYCGICDTELQTGIGFSHLNSKRHIENLQRKKDNQE